MRESHVSPDASPEGASAMMTLAQKALRREAQERQARRLAARDAGLSPRRRALAKLSERNPGTGRPSLPSMWGLLIVRRVLREREASA